jgi:hypothetical protein
LLSDFFFACLHFCFHRSGAYSFGVVHANAVIVMAVLWSPVLESVAAGAGFGQQLGTEC